jgi:hypothetical protein
MNNGISVGVCEVIEQKYCIHEHDLFWTLSIVLNFTRHSVLEIGYVSNIIIYRGLYTVDPNTKNCVTGKFLIREHDLHSRVYV